MQNDDSLEDVASLHKGRLSWTNYMICYWVNSNGCRFSENFEANI
jgi:hypothetical protein